MQVFLLLDPLNLQLTASSCLSTISSRPLTPPSSTNSLESHPTRPFRLVFPLRAVSLHSRGVPLLAFTPPTLTPCDATRSLMAPLVPPSLRPVPFLTLLSRSPLYSSCRWAVSFCQAPRCSHPLPALHSLGVQLYRWQLHVPPFFRSLLRLVAVIFRPRSGITHVAILTCVVRTCAVFLAAVHTDNILSGLFPVPLGLSTTSSIVAICYRSPSSYSNPHPPPLVATTLSFASTRKRSIVLPGVNTLAYHYS